MFIKSCQVLACRLVCRHVIQSFTGFSNWLIVCIDRLASYQLTVAFSNFAGTDSRAPSVFISCLVCIRGCGLAIRTFQVLTDVGGIDIGLACQLRICCCAGIRDSVVDSRVDRIARNEVLVTSSYRAIVVRRNFIGDSACFLIISRCNRDPVSSLNLDGIFRQVLDHCPSFIRDVGQILQVRDVTGILGNVRCVRGDVLRVRANSIRIRLDMFIKSCQVLACRLVCRHVIQSFTGFSNWLIVCIDRLASYQLTVAFSNFAGTDSRAPSVFISCLVLFRDSCAICFMIQVLPDVICIHISLHAVQFLQLCDIDGIGFLFTSSHASNLTSFICCTNGYSRLLGRPCSCGICGLFIGSSRIIPGDTSCSRCFGSAADGYAALSADFCVVADGYDIGGCRFIVGGIGRTDDDVVLLVRQFVVITEDDVGLVRIYAVTADLVLRADDIVVLAVGQFILEAIDEVILRRRTFCISAVCARDFVADAGDLCHIGFVNGVAAAHNHDLSTAGRNCILQSIFQLFSVPG